MTNVLHITNGDSAVSLLREAGITGHYLPWRDVLHDGPVPGDLSLEELSKVRAKFIADMGWASHADAEQDFNDRDDTLKNCFGYSKVLLWFEHDLYDQLQILQILDWFAEQDMDGFEVGLICTEQYLGHMTPDSIGGLMRFEEKVTGVQLHLAHIAWNAFRAPTPLDWFELLEHDTSALPFLRDAILRMLEEYPNTVTGLSKTETRLMTRLDAGVSTPAALFSHNQQQEQRVFLGDWSFWEIINGLISTAPPLVAWVAGAGPVTTQNVKHDLGLTESGRHVLSGQQNRLDIDRFERWYGGVEPNQVYTWCWDASACRPQKRMNN